MDLAPENYFYSWHQIIVYGLSVLTGPGCSRNPWSAGPDNGTSSLLVFGGFSMRDLKELQQHKYISYENVEYMTSSRNKT